MLRFERDGAWVRENIAIKPVVLKETDQYVEYVVGKTDLMYYETHRIELCTGGVYEGSNNGQFTVVTVVDGEQARISSKSHPEFSYTARFLDVVTIPATIEDYEIRAEGYQPVVIPRKHCCGRATHGIKTPPTRTERWKKADSAQGKVIK